MIILIILINLIISKMQVSGKARIWNNLINLINFKIQSPQILKLILLIKLIWLIWLISKAEASKFWN